MGKFFGVVTGLGLLVLSAAGTTAHAQGAPPQPTICTGGDVPSQVVDAGASGAVQPDLLIEGVCIVHAKTQYFYHDVNVIALPDPNFPGKFLPSELLFADEAAGNTDFWADTIIVENHGTMEAGTPAKPFGKAGNVLTIHLYGADQGGTFNGKQDQGTICATPQPVLHNPPQPGDTPPCGIPATYWGDNGKTFWNGANALPGNVADYFYDYSPLHGDGAADSEGRVGYFGYKSIGLSFGGVLELHGYKGLDTAAIGNNPVTAATDNPLDTGTSWLRLKSGVSLTKGENTLQVDLSATDKAGNPLPDKTIAGNWQPDDHIVVTTTDFLPSHSEELTITNVSGATITFTRTGCTPTGGDTCGALWLHNGNKVDLGARLDDRLKSSFAPDLVANGIDTRAAVALLSRSIRIVSEGDAPDAAGASNFPAASTHYFFGGQTVARQGFKAFHVEGVDFKQLGQGGRIGHYPVHFHMARQTPQNTYIRDSSINESMTRWIVIHSTLGVEMARNVGWESIGHGFYLEDGTETDNKLYSNIGISARAAVANAQNPRMVPGILADNTVGSVVDSNGVRTFNQVAVDGFPYVSDWAQPTVFWITNGWNDFIGNMAVGAGTGGSCYWLMGAYDTNITDAPPGANPMAMRWSGYAGLQKNGLFAGSTPLKSFYRNSCSSAPNAFQTVGSTAAVQGVVTAGLAAANNPAFPVPPGDMVAIQSFAPEHSANLDQETYYPQVPGAQGRAPTTCPATTTPPGMAQAYDCSGITVPCSNGDSSTCGVTVLDHFTTSFNSAPYNFSALWLRPQWYLVTDSAITDTLGAGITFVSGGDYTKSSVIDGYWALAQDSVFIGATQKQTGTTPGVDYNPYALTTGPFSPVTGSAAPTASQCVQNVNHCVNADAGVTIPLDNFGVNQRMFNIYDGPVYQDSNAYLDIRATQCTSADCLYRNVVGLRVGTTPGTTCYMPNAAIGWKQPNGFYYPPAFHSDNLYFNNVDIRHFVIEPLFTPGTYNTATGQITAEYCGNTGFTFAGYTDIDRQTELSDDDGTLTGLINNNVADLGDPLAAPITTISVNGDPFFQAPIFTPECKSAFGVNPNKACDTPPKYPTPQTADTSPYEYVTSVVIAGCTQTGGNVETLCGSSKARTQPGSGGVWSQNCGAPFCYGVPLYRQFLTGREWASWTTLGCSTEPARDSAACKFPFIRMSGQSSYQRSTLTANHGTYYLDTTVPDATQRTEAFTDPSVYPRAVPRPQCARRAASTCSSPGRPITSSSSTAGRRRGRRIRSMSAPASSRPPTSPMCAATLPGSRPSSRPAPGLRRSPARQSMRTACSASPSTFRRLRANWR